jgi:NAD(P)H-quinone oxidoreductase subunit 5
MFIFELTPISLTLSVLVLFIAGLVVAFSRRYMDGDANIRSFYAHLGLLTLSALAFVVTDHLIVLAISWAAMGYFLSRLIGHVKTWPQARRAGKLALSHFMIGAGSLIIAITLMVQVTGQWRLSTGIDAFIATAETGQLWMMAGLITIAALIQSANLPFHKWLTSSLTAPTPVSAFMHAGIVNAGGILIIKFHPAFSALPSALLILFFIGGITAIIGNAWMAIQPTVKGQLANSTVAQMGFMILQCGLGLYTAALAHLILHGMYKAYYFLNAGSAVVKKHPDTGMLNKSIGKTSIIGLFNILTGIITGVLFAVITGKSIISPDGSAILVMIAGLAGAQLCYGLMRRTGAGGVIPAIFLAVIGAALYAICFNAITAVAPINAPVTLNNLHLAMMGLFAIGWMIQLFGGQDQFKQLYVRLLNGGQASSNTVMTNRGEYHAG